jgi:hypothetical protein
MKIKSLLHKKMLLIVTKKSFKFRKCKNNRRSTNLNNTKGGCSSINTKAKSNNTKRNTTITKAKKYLNNIA